MPSERLAALRARREAAAAEFAQLIITRAQRAGEVEQRWADHQALRAAIYRTVRAYERTIAGARATIADRPHSVLTAALNRRSERSRERLAPVVSLRPVVSSEVQQAHRALAGQL